MGKKFLYNCPWCYLAHFFIFIIIDDSDNNRLLIETEDKNYKLRNVTKCKTLAVRSGKFNVSISASAHLCTQL